MLWAAINHVDKHLMSKYFDDVPAAVPIMFTSATAGLFAIFFGVFFKVTDVTPFQAFIVALSGAGLVCAYIPYMSALRSEEASTVAPLWQLITVCTFFLGLIFLKETLNAHQLVAAFLMILAAGLFTFNPQNFKFKKRTFFLMLTGSFLISCNIVAFKFIALQTSFVVSAFWEYIGGLAVLGIFLLVPIYRKGFVDVIRKYRGPLLGWNFSTEALNLFARLAVNYAGLLVPVVFVNLVNSTQPIFILLYGVLMALIFGYKKDLVFSRDELIRKSIAAILIVVGAYWLFF
jgi:drug/metabolite transporter (DMT)-like permease